jgi:hypothetical protein
LFFHCISGVEIKDGLMNTLQNKLDDAVLDILFVQLNRNPMSKLSAEDVHVSDLFKLFLEWIL